jgi:hypothetical protein
VGGTTKKTVKQAGSDQNLDATQMEIKLIFQKYPTDSCKRSNWPFFSEISTEMLQNESSTTQANEDWTIQKETTLILA